jgi:drug/metabolite transporter (DMT)-like permease
MRVARIKLTFLVASLIAIWCGNFIALKICLRALSPLGVTSFRTTAAAIILYAIHKLLEDKQTSRQLKASDLAFFLKLAFLGLVLNQLLFITGLHYTTVAHSAVLVTFGPMFTMLFAWMQGQERLTPLRVAGMGVSIVGVVCLNLGRDLRLHTEYLAGDLLTFCGSVAFAYYTVLSKEGSVRYGSVPSTAFTYLAGACVLFPAGMSSFVDFSSSSLTWDVIISFFYVAVMASVLAPLIFYYALRHMSASRFASLTYLQPIVTTLSSALILSEQLTANFIIGGCLVLAGVLLTQHSSHSAGFWNWRREASIKDLESYKFQDSDDRIL